MRPVKRFIGGNGLDVYVALDSIVAVAGYTWKDETYRQGQLAAIVLVGGAQIETDQYIEDILPKLQFEEAP